MRINQKAIQGVMFDEGIRFADFHLNMLPHDGSFSGSNALGLSAVMLDIVLKHNCLIEVISEGMNTHGHTCVLTLAGITSKVVSSNRRERIGIPKYSC